MNCSIHTSANDNCAICMKDYSENKCKVDLGCSHHFHYSCLLTWNLQSGKQTNHRSCPICRGNIGIDKIIDKFSDNQPEDPDAIDYDGGDGPIITTENENTFSEDSSEMHERHMSIIESINSIMNSREANLSTTLERQRVQTVTRIDQGLQLSCRDCNSCLKSCTHCSTKICNCAYCPDDDKWQYREYYCPRTPFKTPDTDNRREFVDDVDIDLDESPEITYCARCFESRDNLVVDYLVNILETSFILDDKIFDTPKMLEFFNHLFNNNSRGELSDNLLNSYPSYSFEEFKEYIHTIYNDRLTSMVDDIITSIDNQIENVDFDEILIGEITNLNNDNMNSINYTREFEIFNI